MGLGVLQVLVSLVPDNYKWMTGVIGLEGSLEQGMNEIRLVAEYDGGDRITGMYRPQATFFMAFLGVNLQMERKGAIRLLERFRELEPGDQTWSSPLMIYVRAVVMMKNGMNDQALAALQERKSPHTGFPFLYLDYLEGTARLNKLDTGAREYFRCYIRDFRGMNYLRAAYQRLAWISLLEGDTAGYRELMTMASVGGALLVEEDRQAKNDAGSGLIPSPLLLRARLLFDGGYYDLTMKELLNNPLKSSVKTKRDLVEYTYRLGRICQETGKDTRALEYFRLTVERGRSEPCYFASNAAYQAGLLYEKAGAYARADSAYRLCLSIKPSEYRMSIHQKARVALERIRPFQPKT